MDLGLEGRSTRWERSAAVGEKEIRDFGEGSSCYKDASLGKEKCLEMMFRKFCCVYWCGRVFHLRPLQRDFHKFSFKTLM